MLADGDKLKQVFWNFTENAVRAMKDNGGTLTVSLVERGQDWEMSFSDTGPGISPQQTEKIFEPFQSNFEGGTGLGLAIVYQIVQAHEGKVWARSEVGKGTSFVVRLRRLEAGLPVLSHERIASGRGCCRSCGRRDSWVAFWSATTSAPSANCSTSPCAAKATKSKP